MGFSGKAVLRHFSCACRSTFAHSECGTLAGDAIQLPGTQFRGGPLMIMCP